MHPGVQHVHCSGGPVRRAINHTAFVLHDSLIGYPDQFVVPPLGASLYATMSAQKAKADMHTFTLYDSDFIAGTNELAPSGAYRLSFLASRLPAWSGPVVVEWTPDAPDLARARRETIVAALQGAQLPVNADRVVIGPSPYRGMMGVEAANNYDIYVLRSLMAPRTYSVSPTSTASFGGGSR